MGSAASEALSQRSNPFERSEERRSIPRGLIVREWARDLCGPELIRQMGCLVAERREERQVTPPLVLSDRVLESGNADNAELAVVPIPAAAPFLLSALAGLAFASRGRRGSR
jgi:hypothetical protein